MQLPQMNDSVLSTLHDRLVAEMPEGATHESTTCPLCSIEEDRNLTTFSEEEVAAKIAAAVSSATSELSAKVTELEGAQASSQIETRIAEARAEGEAKVAELQAALDAKAIEAQAEKERADKLETEKTEVATKAEADARRDERVAKAKEVAGFNDDYLIANGDRFAAMSDEEFATAVEGWTEARTAALATATTDPSKVPVTTALTATRESDSANAPTGVDLAREVADLGLDGVDVRRI